MSNRSKIDHHTAADRFVRYCHQDWVLKILIDQKPWVRSETGQSVLVVMGYLADQKLSGAISREQYDSELRHMSEKVSLAENDFHVMARAALEFARCAFFASGEKPLRDTAWDGGEEL